MANKTLLNAVNEVLKRVGSINSDGGELTTLVLSARQRSVDVAVQVINEGMDELYLTCEKPAPTQQVSATITLVEGTRSYALATDLVRLRLPMIDRDSTQYIYEYKGGFAAILLNDPEQDDTGLPMYGAINPEDGEFYLDRAPDTASDGKVYTYQYDRDMVLAAVDDEFPFNNLTFRAMVPAWVQLWRRDMQKEFDEGLYRQHVGRASRALSHMLPRTSYCNR